MIRRLINWMRRENYRCEDCNRKFDAPEYSEGLRLRICPHCASFRIWPLNRKAR
tara:strand:- start:9540 stop:9701 length:162 start_codon:yes stop_codon:yes gene_type:complete